MSDEACPVTPYTKQDLERGEELVKRLHGVKGFEAWAELIAKELASERERATSVHEDGRARRAAIW